MSAGTARGSLAKGSWHGVAVTEGFHGRHFPKAPTHVEMQHPIAPSGRELSPQVTEGACGQESDGLLLGGTCSQVSIPYADFTGSYLEIGNRKF